MARQLLELLTLFAMLVSAQTSTYYTILSLYSELGCSIGSNLSSLTPTAANGNCTNLDGTYGLTIAQLGTGCNVQYFQKRDCPSGSFAADAYVSVCSGFSGALIGSVRLIGCQHALPQSSAGSTTTTVSMSSSTSTRSTFITSKTVSTTANSQTIVPSLSSTTFATSSRQSTYTAITTPTTSPGTDSSDISSSSSSGSGFSTDKIVGTAIAAVVAITGICALAVTFCCGGIGNVLAWLGLKEKREASRPSNPSGHTVNQTGTFNHSGNWTGRDQYNGTTNITNNYH